VVPAEESEPQLTSSNEEPEIDLDEELVRRIPRADVDSFRTLRPARTNFEPKKNEVEGISIWRSRLRPITEHVTATGKDFYFACFTLRELLQLGLSVKRMRSIDGPGHCVIPELSIKHLKEPRTAEACDWLATNAALKGPFKTVKRQP